MAAVAAVGIAHSGLGLPPVEEFLSPVSWLEALPRQTVLRISVQDGPSFLTTAGQILESPRLGAVVERIRIQLRLADLSRER